MALFPLSPLHSARMEFIQLLVLVLHSDWPSSILRVLIFIIPALGCFTACNTILLFVNGDPDRST